MDLITALRTMDFTNLPDRSQLERRFIELAKLKHPDTGGTDAEFIELESARMKIEEAITAGSSIMAIEKAQSAIELLIRRDEYQRSNAKLTAALIKHRTHPLRGMRRMYATLVVAIGGLFGIWTGLIPLAQSMLSSIWDQMLVDMIGVMLFITILPVILSMALIMQKITTTEQCIQELSDNLSERGYFMSAWEAFPFGDGPVSEADITKVVIDYFESDDGSSKMSRRHEQRPLYGWYRQVGLWPRAHDEAQTLESAIHTAGVEAFVRLLVGRGCELGILEPTYRARHERQQSVYSVNKSYFD